MDDLREKVLRGLACLSNPFVQDADERDCEHCSYDSASCFLDITSDALSLLKAQEPRVMTLDEVEALPYGYVLIETDKKDSLHWVDALLFCKNTNFSFDFITLEGRARLLGTAYNMEWRCWTARPTDEQREAVKWE